MNGRRKGDLRQMLYLVRESTGRKTLVETPGKPSRGPSIWGEKGTSEKNLQRKERGESF